MVAKVGPVSETGQVHLQDKQSQISGSNTRKWHGHNGSDQGGGRLGVANWKTPKNVRDIRKFFRFINFYQCFIPNHSKKAKPINDLLKKGVPFKWKEEQEKAFQELKQVVQTELVLLQPDQKKPFKVEIDVSNYAIGAMLMQKDETSSDGLLF